MCVCEYTHYLDNPSAVGVIAHNTQHHNARKLAFGEDFVGFSDVSGISTMRLVVGVISAMVEKNWGKGTLALTP